jgi:tRNA (guanine37-N1)-methyltransferase
MFRGPFDQSIVRRAKTDKHITISTINIRDFALDSHKSVDDHPYGGGHGMVMRVDVVDRALLDAKNRHADLVTRTILLDPQGIPYKQSMARQLSTYEHLILICGHYEAFDERIRAIVDEEISIGDYILTGGEIPAMVIVDSVVRLIPGVLKQKEATVDESFSTPILEYPQYAKPQKYKGRSVPAILLSGNHKKISLWRYSQAKKRTAQRRPDLSA